MENLKKAIIKISELIKSTAGAGGRTILINNGCDCVATKDGISVLNAYKPLNDIELSAKLLLQQALSRQLFEHGDGTTATACFFAEFLKDEYDLEKIKKIDKLVDKLKNKILNSAVHNFDIKDIALVSSNFNEEIANIVSTAIKSNGVNGSYIVEPSSVLGIELQQVNGFEFKFGFTDPIFMNYGGRCEFEKPLFLIKRDIRIEEVAQFTQLAIDSGKPLVVIGDYDEQVRQSIVYNHSQGICRYCLISLKQSFGKEKDDLINDLNKIVQNCNKIIIKNKSTIIIHNTDIEEYVLNIEKLEVASDVEKEYLNTRIARLKGQVCKIKIGERTTAGLRSKLDSIDDCIKSCISALKYGVVTGGGYALLKFSKRNMIKNIANSYYSAILENSGLKPDGKFHNLLKNYKICDSAGVVASSLCNAWAGAREVLYSHDLIINKKD